MKYETKFNLGDSVWTVSTSEFRRIVRCKPCSNTGKITIADEELLCPKCNGRSTHTEYAGRKHYISHFGAMVGQVRIENTDRGQAAYFRDDEPNPKIEYMLDATGVGSGTIWREEMLFGSLEEARSFCDRKNGALAADESEHGEPIVGQYGEVLRVTGR